LAADSTNDLRWHREAREVAKDLTNGASLNEALKAARSLPPLVRWMLATGEKQGTLAATLRQLSETYRRRALRRSAIIKIWLPVCMTIFVTGSIGLTYSLAFFLPLRDFLMGLSQ
jgi:type II secretory pathway component PulF